MHSSNASLECPHVSSILVGFWRVLGPEGCGKLLVELAVAICELHHAHESQLQAQYAKLQEQAPLNSQLLMPTRLNLSWCLAYHVSAAVPNVAVSESRVPSWGSSFFEGILCLGSILGAPYFRKPTPCLTLNLKPYKPYKPYEPYKPSKPSKPYKPYKPEKPKKPHEPQKPCKPKRLSCPEVLP